MFMVLLLIFVSSATERLNDSASAQVLGLDVLYTTDADFDQGTLVSVNHDSPYNDQLQLDQPTEPFPFINVAASGRGTVVRVSTETGQIVGEYRTAPEGRGMNPSRTTVDLFGNVWTANRDEVGELGGVPHGSAVKIGLIVGGIRADADGTPNPNGDYLAPPFGYNTCADRDNDGLIKTSRGLGDIRPWPDISDGVGGVDGIVEDADDECILIYQRLYNAEQARHVSVDADNNVWVGGYPSQLRMFYKLDADTGAILDSFDARDIGCGGYGGLIDGNGILWSVGDPLLRYDPSTRSGSCIREYGYGLGIDTNGFIWMSLWDGGIVKIAPDGTVVGGFPKPTYPPSMTSTLLASLGTSRRMSASTSKEAEIMSIALAEPDQATFQVAPNDDWVQSSSPWIPGSTISLTIEDGSGVVYADSQTADSGGNFHFSLWDVFDLQRGHVVTVSDGTSTKTHTVADLFVDSVNVTNDMLYGRADAGTDVGVWVHGYDGMTVTADGSGNWTADFSGITDITYNSDGGSQQIDDDGDSTWVWWGSPRFQVAPNDNWVQSSGTWPAGATVSLTIEDGGGLVYADSQTADEQGRFIFDLWNVFDLQRGHVVTVSDGMTTKTHTVMDLYVDGIDVTADTLYGRADAGTDVDVWVAGYDGMTVTADDSGNWTADFSGITDITYNSDGGSQQVDDDGDSTWVWWGSPRFQVAPDDNWVQSSGTWPAGATVSLTIEDGGGLVYADSQTADEQGRFIFDLWNVFDLQRGHVVTVSDGMTTKTHTVMDLYVDGVDVTADTLFGRADADTQVHVWVHGDGSLTTTADGSGNWVADFSGTTDLTYLSDGGSQQIDDDGDSTGVWWASPKFQVSPEDEWVQSWSRWPAGATISLTIEDGSGVLYSDSQTADGDGYFSFNLWDVFDLQRGHVVTVSDGTTTKIHTVMGLFVDGIDVTADTVFGRADPGSSVEVWVHGNGSLIVTADGSGNWIADFSGMADITYLSDGGSRQIDDDGDSTGVWWALPSFQVSLDDGWVQQWSRWMPGSTISLTIEDDSGVVYVDSQTADTHGNFSFNMWQEYLVSGNLVNVSDGTTTKTHTIIDVTVTSIDTEADQVHGSASPGARVLVSASMFDEQSSRWVMADSGGNWMADFSVLADGQPIYDINNTTRLYVSEFDDDGDATQRRFGPPVQQNRGVAVTPIDNHVWVANSGVRTVTRLDNDGNVLKVIETGQEPTGVAVDAAGKVWTTNLGSDNAVRIDPNAGPDGLGAVDLTVDLGPWASPYNYSDMTGAVVVGSTAPHGLWTVVHDSQTPGFEWGRITWNNEPEGSEPTGTSIVIEARAADTEAGLGGQPFIPVLNGELFSMFGRFIEVRATLKASPGGVSPVLSDIRVQPHVIYVDIDIKPGSYPNSINCNQPKEVISVAVLTTDDFDAMIVDHTSVTFEGASEIHVDKKTGESQRHEEDVDLDGDMDLVFHFRLGDTGLTCWSTEGVLTGETYDGIPVMGSDSVRMVNVGACGSTPDSAGGSCQDIYDQCPGVPSGEKWIAPDGTTAILAYCNMDEEGNGWTLIYNRNNAYFSPDQMYHELPAQGPDFTSNSTNWFIPKDATRWRWEVSVDGGASYRTLETSIPPEAMVTTHATVVNAPFDAIYENTTGANGPFYFQTIVFSDRCLYGCGSDGASWWGIVNVFQGAGDQDNPGLGGHTDSCSMNSMLLPGDNYTWGDGDLEYYLSDWKDIGGEGIGGTNCIPDSPTTQYRYRVWAR
jgi:hypothetical protein